MFSFTKLIFYAVYEINNTVLIHILAACWLTRPLPTHVLQQTRRTAANWHACSPCLSSRVRQYTSSSVWPLHDSVTQTTGSTTLLHGFNSSIILFIGYSNTWVSLIYFYHKRSRGGFFWDFGGRVVEVLCLWCKMQNNRFIRSHSN